MALAAAGSLKIGDAARLLRIRGEAMQNATPVGVGAMAALLGLEVEAAAEVAREAAQGEVCDVANDNGSGQVVVSGYKAAVERTIEGYRRLGDLLSPGLAERYGQVFPARRKADGES